MPICSWHKYSKLFKSITRMTQMSLFTHLDSFLPISTPATVLNHLFWMHGQSASPCGAFTHFFQPVPAVNSSGTLRSCPKYYLLSYKETQSTLPLAPPTVHASMGTPYTIIAYIEYLHIVQNISLVFMLLSYSEYYITPHFIEGTNFEKLSHLHSKVYIVKWIIQGSNPGQSD